MLLYFLSLFCKVAFCQPFLSLNEYEWMNEPGKYDGTMSGQCTNG